MQTRGLGLERPDEIAGAGEAVGGSLGERLGDGGIHFLGHGFAQHAQVRGTLRHELGNHGLRVRAGDGRLAREHLVQHCGEGIDVAPCIDAAVARGLLGTHVLRCAERKSGLRKAVAAGLLHGQRDAEVGEHGLAFLDEDVLRLDVAVDEALAVRIVERTRHLLRDGDGFVEAKLVFAIQLVAQGFAADIGKDVVEESVGLARVDEGEDVRMIELRGDLDLGEKALAAEDGAEFGAEDLERHLAIELAVAGEVDDGHSAGAKLSLDDVAVIEGRWQKGRRVHAWKVRPLREARQWSIHARWISCPPGARCAARGLRSAGRHGAVPSVHRDSARRASASDR